MFDWNFNQIHSRNDTLYRIYHQHSKHTPHLQMLKAPRREYEVKSLDTSGAKTAFSVPLVKDMSPLEMPLGEALQKRRTSWKFSNTDLETSSLKKLLSYSFGVSDEIDRKRTYPSGGQFYPIEIYFIPTQRTIKNRILEPKVYKYNVDSNEVVEICEFDVSKINKITGSTDVGFFSFDQCQIIVFLVAEDKDIFVKYLDLSYRIILLDAGHMAQNFLLTCAALNLASVPVGGFYEDEIKRILQLENTSKMVVYTLLGG